MKQLLWLLIVLTGLPASGQYDYSPSCERAHALVTSLRFEEARIVLDSGRQQSETAEDASITTDDTDEASADS